MVIGIPNEVISTIVVPCAPSRRVRPLIQVKSARAITATEVADGAGKR